MDVIDSELKRYDSMQTDLENFKKSFDNLNAAAKDQSKSFDDLDTLMNEEKPKEVRKRFFLLCFICHQMFSKLLCIYSTQYSDGTTTQTNSRVKTAAKIRKLV